MSGLLHLNLPSLSISSTPSSTCKITVISLTQTLDNNASSGPYSPPLSPTATPPNGNTFLNQPSYSLPTSSNNVRLCCRGVINKNNKFQTRASLNYVWNEEFACTASPQSTIRVKFGIYKSHVLSVWNRIGKKVKLKINPEVEVEGTTQLFIKGAGMLSIAWRIYHHQHAAHVPLSPSPIKQSPPSSPKRDGFSERRNNLLKAPFMPLPGIISTQPAQNKLTLSSPILMSSSSNYRPSGNYVESIGDKPPQNSSDESGSEYTTDSRTESYRSEYSRNDSFSSDNPYKVDNDPYLNSFPDDPSLPDLSPISSINNSNGSLSSPSNEQPRPANEISQPRPISFSQRAVKATFGLDSPPNPLSQSAPSVPSIPSSPVLTPPTSAPTTPPPTVFSQYSSNSAEIELDDWNGRFQKIMDHLPPELGSSAMRKDTEERHKWLQELVLLTRDFLHAATLYGRIIISEKHLPDSQKTISPIRLGGKAGGTKYRVHNILFKFPSCSSIYAKYIDAAKTAGHDLKGLQMYFDCGVEGLCFPFMALIDYKGYRLVAASILPIDSTTLVVNSNNAGKNVVNLCPDLQDKLKQAASILGLSSHFVGQNKQEIHSAIDLEGHIGKDGRYYLLDFARAIPPEAIPSLSRGPTDYLVKLLRPEFLRSHSVPLSPDAFSPFETQEERAKTEADIMAATTKLHTVVIPKCARELSSLLAIFAGVNQQSEPTSLTQSQQRINQGYNYMVGTQFAQSFFRLKEIVHSSGLNLRHLGEIVKVLLDELYDTSKHKDKDKILIRDCIRLLLMEMVARVFKNLVRELFRAKMEQTKQPMEGPFRLLLADYLNLLLQDNLEARNFWDAELVPRIKSQFQGWNFAETIEYLRAELDLEYLYKKRRSVDIDKVTSVAKDSLLSFDAIFGLQMRGRLLLLLRVERLLGIKFSLIAKRRLYNPDVRVSFQDEKISVNDIDDIGERVKFMNIVVRSEGHLLLSQANKLRTDRPTAIELFRQAILKFEEALDSGTTSAVLIDCASALQKLYTELKKIGHEDTNLLRRAEVYFQRAIAMDDGSYNQLCYAYFLESTQNRFDEAENCYLSVLEKNRYDIFACYRYSNFLNNARKLHDLAAQFWQRYKTLELSIVKNNQSTNTQQTQLQPQSQSSPLKLSST